MEQKTQKFFSFKFMFKNTTCGGGQRGEDLHQAGGPEAGNHLCGPPEGVSFSCRF